MQLWEAGVMRLVKSTKIIAEAIALAGLALLFSGCGSKNTANVITVTVTSSAGTVIIVGSSTTLTATVTGATNTKVNWTPGCQYTTSTTDSSGKTTTSTATDCPSDGSLGKLTNQVETGTATYTAPGQLPDQTKYPGLQIVITVQSQQDTKKTGKVSLVLDSGISTTLTPATVTVPTKEHQLFNVSLTNDLQSQGVTWLLTQQSQTSTTPFPKLTTCSPSCGTLTDVTGTTVTYVAPDTVPTATTPSGASTTPAILTIVATAKADVNRFATGTITIIQGGPITFNGISPTIAPQGAALWDIYLDAPNISSASIITLTDQNNGTLTFDSTTGKIKVLFPIPTSTTPNPASTGARLRLLEGDLQGALAPSPTPLTYTVSVSDPGQPVTQTAGGNFTFTLMPVRPTVLASAPDSLIQGATTNEFPVAIDGGYFGPNGRFANVSFQAGNTIPQGPSSNSRQLNGTFQSAAVGPPGLYQLSVARTTPPDPTPNNPAVTNLAVFPDYSTSSPSIAPAPASAGVNPSAIDIDPILGVLVVAETGSNQVEFFSIGSGSLTSLGTAAVAQLPTGVSVNRKNHTAAVVSYGSLNSSNQTINQTVTVLPIPTSAVGTVTPLFTVDLSGLLSGVNPAPLPYAIGVDSDTNLALVAYSSTSSSSFANLGFVVNLNQGTGGAITNCPLQDQISGSSTAATPPCLFSQVTLNTGAYPQIAMAPHGHIAYVTPGTAAAGGGGGVVRGVDVTHASTNVGISSLTLTSGIVTVTTSGTLTGLSPGNPGTVFITGVPAPNTTGNPTAANFNGVFVINVTSSTTFTYALNSTASGTANGGTVFYGTPNLNFSGLSTTTHGIAINPITHTAALADANATGTNGAQINLLNQLDQSVSSIRFFSGCTAYSPTCSNSAEVLGPAHVGTADVAWQPYSNAIVSYNPGLNQLSVSDPVTQRRRALVSLPGQGASQLTVQNGTNGVLDLWGGLAVDPATNQAFVVESSTGDIQVLNLGSLKPVEVTEVLVPGSNPGAIGGVPGASLPQATLTSSNDLAGVQIFGSGFASGTVQVNLDNTSIPSANVQVVSDRQITVTIPASLLSTPHRYALDVAAGGVQSNATDFMVLKAVDMTVACTSGPPQPSSVAIADQLKNGPFSPIAVVTNTGCNSISTVDINPASPTFGTVLNTIPVGAGPQGIAVSGRLGLAVVANNTAGTASVVDLTTQKLPVPDVTTGTTPIGVAINDATGAALIANFGNNTVTEINLGLLSGASPATSLAPVTIGGIQQPIAVAIDPDRGTHNQGLAIVTGLQLVSGSSPFGALYPVDIGSTTPALSSSTSIGSVTSTPTGIVFNPAVATGSQHPGLFYANSSGSNVIATFNPDTGGTSSVSVGINPTALAVNPQTGAVLTSNFGGQSASIVDTVSSPFKTRQTLGIPGSPQFGVAIDQFTNLAVIVDQANNRLLLFAMPN
jgi:DNA-binding beta-propeller fold protein YncE